MGGKTKSIIICQPEDLAKAKRAMLNPKDYEHCFILLNCNGLSSAQEKEALISDVEKCRAQWEEQIPVTRCVLYNTSPRSYLIEIRNYDDYRCFFSVFLEDGVLGNRYKGCRFCFEIPVEIQETQKVDELIFFYSALVANHFTNDASFAIRIRTSQTYQEFTASQDYYRLGTYLMVQIVQHPAVRILIKSKERDGFQTRSWPAMAVNGMRNLLPLLTVNGELLELFQSPVTPDVWRKIKNYSIERISGKKAAEILFYLCHRFLFGEIEDEDCLNKLRMITFSREDFFRAIQGLPLLSLLVFALFDYQYRTDLAKQYKEEIRGESKRGVRLVISDFLSELQDLQKYDRYQAHCRLQEIGLDNKTLLSIAPGTLYRKRGAEPGLVLKKGGKTVSQTALLRQMLEGLKESGSPATPEYGLAKADKSLLSQLSLHPRLVGELYEAVTVTEGLLQLLENVVFHAQKTSIPMAKGDKGTGLLSIHIHRCDPEDGRGGAEDDRADLEKHYSAYMASQRELWSGGAGRQFQRTTRYYLEIKIADLSTTDIARKFKDNHRDFIAGSFFKDTFTSFQLKSFFAPTADENQAWENFYGNSNHVVNHYGLQIFNSIVRSKKGFFYVTSQDYLYNSLVEGARLPNAPFVTGTSYTILLPLHTSYTNEKNIYDSMLGYDLSGTPKSSAAAICYEEIPKMEKSIGAVKEKEEYIARISGAFKHREEYLIHVIDASQLSSIECTVKGVIFYIYCHQGSNLHFAFIHCKTHEIVNIVRLFSLFYNRQAENKYMKQVQVYIRGEKVGEELLLFGEKLPEVENNIAKIACMRGILYENYEILHDIFRRDGLEGGAEK